MAANPPPNNPTTMNATAARATSMAHNNRFRFNASQTARLEQLCDDTGRYPDTAQKRALAQQLGVELRSVHNWFETKRRTPAPVPAAGPAAAAAAAAGPVAGAGALAAAPGPAGQAAVAAAIAAVPVFSGAAAPAPVTASTFDAGLVSPGTRLVIHATIEHVGDGEATGHATKKVKLTIEPGEQTELADYQLAKINYAIRKMEAADQLIQDARRDIKEAIQELEQVFGKKFEVEYEKPGDAAIDDDDSTEAAT